MEIDVLAEVTIHRPRPEVAAFMFDPHNDVTWTSGVVESRPLEGGRLHTGSRVVRVSKFLGRKFDYQYEVTDTDEKSFVEMRVTEPFPMDIRYELKDEATGTLASIRARGDATGFFRIAGPLLGRMVRRNIANDLDQLRARLEAEGAKPG